MKVKGKKLYLSPQIQLEEAFYLSSSLYTVEKPSNFFTLNNKGAQSHSTYALEDLKKFRKKNQVWFRFSFEVRNMKLFW